MCVSRLNIEFSVCNTVIEHIPITLISNNILELHRPANPQPDELLQNVNSQLCETIETIEVPSNCKETIKLHRIKSI